MVGPVELQAARDLTPATLVAFFYEAACQKSVHLTPLLTLTVHLLRLSPLSMPALQLKPSANHGFSPSPARTHKDKRRVSHPEKLSLCCKIFSV